MSTITMDPPKNPLTPSPSARARCKQSSIRLQSSPLFVVFHRYNILLYCYFVICGLCSISTHDYEMALCCVLAVCMVWSLQHMIHQEARLERIELEFKELKRVKKLANEACRKIAKKDVEKF